jgi:hypothetical protein
VATGDFNGDGNLDLAVANYCGTSGCGNNGSIAILLGNGDGTFQGAVNYGTGDYAFVVAVDDLNGDGKPDLAVGHQNGRGVDILFGNGDGTFQGATNYPDGSAESLALGDLNGDGKPDLAFGDGSVGVLLNNGDGTFGSFKNYSAGSNTWGIVFSDFNGDGKTDVGAVNQSSNNVSLLFGNGDGTFQLPLNYGVGSNPQPVASGDFNEDGAPDLAVGVQSTSNVTILLNTGGTLISLTSSQNPSSFGQAVTFTARITASVPGSGTPSGTVTFYDGSTQLSSSNLNSGVATFQTSTLSVGTHSITVSYAGNAVFNPHTSAVLTQTVTGNAPIVQLTPTSLTFGNQAVGTTSPAQNVTLSNIGNATLSITSIGTSGNFGQTNNCGSSVGAGGSCTISVTFTPESIGTLTGTVSVTDNAAGSPQTVSLTGTGVTGENPIPLIVKPTIPESVAPGGSSFTLTVNGSGFVPGSSVNFNAHARTTTFISSSQLQATILASDIATAQTASVIVKNPAPGGGVSNSVPFPITTSTTSVTLNRTDFSVQSGPRDVASGDFNRDGKLDLVVANRLSNTVSVLLGNGDGTFQTAVNYGTGTGPEALAVADFNADGKLDIAVTNTSSNTVSILLGNGDGTFKSHVDYTTNLFPFAVTAADFNGDGKLDLAIAESNSNTLGILLGNGDGTFQSYVDYAVGVNPTGIAAGDFNRDGKLDLALANINSNSVSILLGNGDGTFQAQVQYASGADTYTVTTEDLNGDGKLDLVTANTGKGSGTTVSVLLGNGDGTFQPHVDYTVGTSPSCAAVADLNGDGKLDLAVANQVSNTISILLGNGDGTFQPHVDYAASKTPFFVVAADFNNNGRTDLAVTNNGANTVSSFMQVAAVSLSPTNLSFGSVNVGSTSPPQTVTLTNTGSATLTISSIAITGTNTGDFAQSNACGSSLAGGASCSIQVTFTPLAVGSRSATLSVTDNASGSPQTVSLSGTGAGTPVVQLSPTSLTFATQLVGTPSASQPVTLTNTGNGTLSITSITITGANPTDFSETNTCGSSVAAGASCTINVTFKPTAKGSRTASVSIADNAAGSPQTVSLKGTGTVVKVSPASLNFGSVKVGTSSPPQKVSVTNTGTTSLSITNIGISGANAGDYSETTTCGTSLGAGASCSISVTFTPRAKGSRVAQLSITDNGGGSPQTASLTGTGM